MSASNTSLGGNQTANKLAERKQNTPNKHPGFDNLQVNVFCAHASCMSPLTVLGSFLVLTFIFVFKYCSCFSPARAFVFLHCQWMFKQATVFNSPLNFDTSSVTDMFGMFAYSAFNQPVSFDTSSVTSMRVSALPLSL